MPFIKVVAMARMGRPFIIVAGLIAFFTGAGMAYWELGEVLWGEALIGLVIMVSAILMAHYANEYADFETDRLTRRTAFSGGSGVLPSEIVPRVWALYAAVAFLLLTLLLTIVTFLICELSTSVVILVFLGVPLGWLYSMPPLALERTPWGEVDNAFLGGFLMPLMGYSPQTGYVSTISILVCVPLFLAVLVNLLGVHWQDRKADCEVGKRTMVVSLGDRTLAAFEILTLMMFISILMLSFIIPLAVVIITLFSLPFGVWAILGFRKNGGPEYGSILMGSVMILMGIGWIFQGLMT